MEIYLAILEDRHIDVQIEPFQKIVGALKQIQDWQSQYTDEIWEEEDFENWEYSVRSECDDGPKMNVEKKVLR